MRPKIDPDDFLDEPSNEQEERVRQTTCTSYTLPEIMAATERIEGGDNNGGRSDSNDGAKKEAKKTNKTKKRQGRKYWEESTEGVNVKEIQEYAKGILKKQGRAGEIVCITMDES